MTIAWAGFPGGVEQALRPEGACWVIITLWTC
jgi:hypothetical protein